MLGISIIILSFNSELTLGNTLNSASKVSDDIHVVDSYSKDKTVEIARTFGVNVVQHEFVNYSAQRNWTMDTLQFTNSWQLHLDADERLSDGLIAELRLLVPQDNINGYFIARLIYFLNRPIYHGGMYPIWHMRLFRNGVGRCENRKYDQHFLVDGETQRLSNPMIDDQKMTISEWTIRHNRWADLEENELNETVKSEQKGMVESRLFGNPTQKKRALKGIYYEMPLLFRAFLLFFYRYVLRAGFLDGIEGLIFFVLQTFWFRFLVDAKLFERHHIQSAKS